MGKLITIPLFVLSLFRITWAVPQDSLRVDSLMNAIKTTPAAEMDVLFGELNKDFEKMPGSRALNFATRCVELSKGNYPAELIAVVNLAKVKGRNGENNQALQLFEEAIQKGQENKNDRFGLAIATLNLGEFFISQHVTSDALRMILDASTLFEELGKYTYVTLCHYLASNLHYSAGNYQQCIEEGYKVLRDHEKIPPEKRNYDSEFQKMSTYNTLALANRALRQYDIAIINYDKAEVIAKQLKNEFWVALINGNKGRVLFELGKYEDALSSLLADYEISKKHEVWASAGRSAITLSEAYLAESNLALAGKYLDSAKILISKDRGVTSRQKLMEAYWLAKAGLDAARKDYVSAYGDFITHEAYHDSVTHEQEALNLSRVRAQYDLDRKQTEIELLSKDNEIQKQRFRAQRLAFIGAIVILLLVLALSYTLILNFRRLKRITKLVREQRDQIGFKNKELEEQSAKLQENNQHIQSLNTQLEQKVAERTRELELANHELDTFLYRSSHDIRRPLTTLLGIENVAQHLVRDEQALQLLANVGDTARSMDSMLFKMLMIYQLNKQLDMRPVSIHHLVHESVNYFEKDFRRVGMTFRSHVPQELSFISNPVLLNIIIRNLLENAVLFRKPHAQQDAFVEITVIQSTAGIEISVTDNGMGIEEKSLPKIFDLYFRGSHHSRGNGLGLYLVRRAVEKLFGSVQVKSEHGSGTTVFVILPFLGTN